MDTARPAVAGSPTRRAAAHHRCSRRDQRDFLFAATGCQWRLLPREFPAWGTVYHYFRTWKNSGVWTCLQRAIYEQARRKANPVQFGKSLCFVLRSRTAIDTHPCANERNYPAEASFSTRSCGIFDGDFIA